MSSRELEYVRGHTISLDQQHLLITGMFYDLPPQTRTRSDWDGISKILAPSLILPNLRHLVLCFQSEYLLHKTKGFTLLDMIRSRCKAGQLKMIETSFEKGSYTAHIMEEDIRAVIGDNVEMRVEEWSPLYLDYWYSFPGPELPEFW